MKKGKFWGFGSASKLASKISATKFIYTFTVHNLTPWPHVQRAVAIGWQRGKSKRGATRSVYPSTAPGRIGSVVRFNEKFDVQASLFKDPNGAPSPSGLGPFKKKCIILAILETDGRTQATAALGRIVIDMAEFAGIEHQETRTFAVTCNKSIHATVGEPQLTVTVRCRWAKSSATAGAAGDMYYDDLGSVSTDTTGSRMTANLSSFLRFKYTKDGPVNEEQDLKGFDAAALASVAAAKRAETSMGTITEDDEPGGGKGGGLRAAAAAAAAAVASTARSVSGMSVNGGGSGKDSGDASPEPPLGAGLGPGSRALVGGANGSASANGRVYGAGGSGGTGAGGGALRDMFGPGSRSMGARSSDAGDGDGGGGAGGGGAGGTMLGSSSYAHSMTPTRSASDIGGGDHLPGAQGASELVTVAAHEVCVYLARIMALREKVPERAVHAPARRIARTMVCLGSGAGSTFGQQVLCLIGAQASALGGDQGGILFWWSNAVHLRGLLQALGTPEYAVGSGTSMRWAADALVPGLLKTERALFDTLMAQVWASVLDLQGHADASAASASAAAAADPKAERKPPATKRALQEAAIKHWFAVLDGTAAKLNTLCARGHMRMLRAQVLSQVLKRLDALLFHHLLTVPGASGAPEDHGLLRDYDPDGTLWGPPGSGPGGAHAAVPPLSDAALPFGRGVLTFGGGMAVKMTVTRLQQWAAGAGIADGGGHSGGHGGGVSGGGGGVSGTGVQFPLLRTAADLLMMPKELLLEQAIRNDVSQALSIRSMVHILSCFRPDEYATDKIAPEVLAFLGEELAVAPSARPPLTDLSLGYCPPGDTAILNKSVGSGDGGGGAREPGIEYEAESEAELEKAGAMIGGGGGVPPRMRALHQLWASGVPRRRPEA
ncbi:hypothetical protein FOA52_014834 [Chlamydomonas sp. UWO 241]|nr:hypothetical protein FOA52_014834 [Chlamydomonas sp. UWO 241]